RGELELLGEVLRAHVHTHLGSHFTIRGVRLRARRKFHVVGSRGNGHAGCAPAPINRVGNRAGRVGAQIPRESVHADIHTRSRSAAAKSSFAAAPASTAAACI